MSALLVERERTHGDWAETARIAVRLKTIVVEEWAARIGRGQSAPTAGQIEALDQICTKIARIISGDPGYRDHWDDIVEGYLPLAEAASRPTGLGDQLRHVASPPLVGADRYTGDICRDCGGMRMVRTGTCVTCLDCGGTGGCG